MEYEEITNYYESLVYDEINSSLVDTGKVTDTDIVNDIACVALNQLPPRYIRYSIDAAFYMSEEERVTMQNNVKIAVENAYNIVRSKPRA